jgi:flagellar motor switch protein FliN/FliY
MVEDDAQQAAGELDVGDEGVTQNKTQVSGDNTRNLDTILRIPVTVQVVLGSASMPVSNLLRLGRGAVIPLDHRVGEPVDVMVNGRVVARGEVVVVEDDNSRFGVSLTEVVGPSSGTE